MDVKLLRILLGLVLVAVGLQPTQVLGQIRTFVARELVIDQKNFELDSGAAAFVNEILAAAKASPEKWDPGAQAVFGNMVFVSAAEAALLRSMQDDGSVALPVKIRKGDLIAGLLLWDTADGSECETPTRIAKGDVVASDVLLFGGDVQKLAKVGAVGAELVKAVRDPSKLDDFVKKVHESIGKSGRKGLVSRVIGSKYFPIQRFLLGMKVRLVTSSSIEAVKKETDDLAKGLGLR